MVRFARLLVIAMVLTTGFTLLSPSVIGAGARTVTVWTVSNVADSTKSTMAFYEQQHPGVTIDLQMMGAQNAQYTEKLMTAIVAGTPPDLAYFVGQDSKEWAARGLLLDVTLFLAGVNFTPGDKAEVSLAGKMYAAPYYTTARGLFKRTDMFEAAGLNPRADPQTIEELDRLAIRLTEKTADGRFTRVGFVPWGSNWRTGAWMWAFGGEVVDASGIRPTFDTPNNIKTYEWIAEWGLRVNRLYNPVANSDTRG